MIGFVEDRWLLRRGDSVACWNQSQVCAISCAATLSLVSKMAANIVSDSLLRGGVMKKAHYSGHRQEPKRNVKRNSNGTCLDQHTRAKVDSHLRRAYDQIVEGGIPDRFVDLFKQLERRKDEEDST